MVLLDRDKPTLDFAIKTMKAFARAGADRISQPSTKPASGSLAEELANAINKQTEGGAFNFAFSPDRMRRGLVEFWPLPEMSGNDQIYAFFKPRIDGTGENSSLVVHLILLGRSDTERIGFRFEKGGFNHNDRHHYLHAQLLPCVSTTEKESIELCSPLFKSCPAMPVPALGQFGSWFAAVTSVAGNQIDEKNGVIRAFTDARDKYIGDDFELVEQALRTVLQRMLFNN